MIVHSFETFLIREKRNYLYYLSLKNRQLNMMYTNFDLYFNRGNNVSYSLSDTGMSTHIRCKANITNNACQIYISIYFFLKVNLTHVFDNTDGFFAHLQLFVLYSDVPLAHILWCLHFSVN
jgi:hypothetical protein